MKITIAERLHPFSHEAGSQFLVPQTTWAVQVFPTRLNFCDLEGVAEPFFLTFDFLGPLQGFTVEVDLERGHLNVFGKTQKGYMRYQLCAKEGGIHLTMEKVPEERVVCRRSSSEEISLGKGESMVVCSQKSTVEMVPQERLSLGMHKAQDWDLVRRRLDCKEIFPAWFLLSSLTPHQNTEETFGNYSLLNACKTKIEQREKGSVLEAFEHLFLAAFDGILVPRLIDSDHQGIVPQEGTSRSLSPLPLLTQSGRLIRSLFIQEKNNEVSLLPCLPPQFHCGRMIRVRTSCDVVLDFEWTKKTLRTVLIESASGGQIQLKLPKGIRSFRMTCGKNVVKKVEVDSEGRAALILEAGKTTQLDRLEH